MALLAQVGGSAVHTGRYTVGVDVGAKVGVRVVGDVVITHVPHICGHNSRIVVLPQSADVNGVHSDGSAAAEHASRVGSSVGTAVGARVGPAVGAPVGPAVNVHVPHRIWQIFAVVGLLRVSRG
jgi:hypothetical protein